MGGSNQASATQLKSPKKNESEQPDGSPKATLACKNDTPKNRPSTKKVKRTSTVKKPDADKSGGDDSYEYASEEDEDEESEESAGETASPTPKKKDADVAQKKKDTSNEQQEEKKKKGESEQMFAELGDGFFTEHA